MLTNCPTISSACAQDRTLLATLVAKCGVIADEMIHERSVNPKTYLGTPDDQRMFQMFGDTFGPIFIGTGEESSGNRVTDLESIRWRTTLLGTEGQRERETQKRFVAAEKAAAQIAAANPSRVALVATITDAPANSGPTRKGKRCSNVNCPDRAHYIAATCKILWSKCKKDCVRCGVENGGSMHVCANLECKQALQIHMSV
jgi:hypothetical protein